MQYDIADQHCLSILNTVQGQATQFDSHAASGSAAFAAASEASRSETVAGALTAAMNRFRDEMSSVENFYALAVAQATYAVVLHQQGDREIAEQAAAAAMLANTPAELPRGRGGRMVATAL